MQVLVHRRADGSELRGRIVETEAYLGGEDKASHSAGGKRTERNTAMFMKPGTIYVYPIYGIYLCMNVSSEGTFTTHQRRHVPYPYFTMFAYANMMWKKFQRAFFRFIVFRSTQYLSNIKASQRFLLFGTG